VKVRSGRLSTPDETGTAAGSAKGVGEGWEACDQVAASEVPCTHRVDRIRLVEKRS